MRHKVGGLLLLLPLMSAHAAVDMDTAAHIYEAAAVRDQVRASLGAMPGRMRDMFAADSKAKLSDTQLAAVSTAATHGFRIDVFEPPALSTLARSLDPNDAKQTLAFLASDVGKRMVAADRALAVLDEPSIDKVMSGELKAPTTAKREALYDKIERAAHSTESTVQIFNGMGRAVAAGAAIGSGADSTEVDARSSKRADLMRKEMEAGMREPLRRYLAYGYRDLSDSDLKQVLAFLQSKQGAHYVQAYTSALGAGFEAMGKRCGEELGESLRELAKANAPPPPFATPDVQGTPMSPVSPSSGPQATPKLEPDRGTPEPSPKH